MDDTPRFEPVGSRLLHQSRMVSLSVGTFRAPDGTLFERDVVHHPGWVAVVPLTDDGEVVCVRQYRPAVDRWMLELPAGVRDVDGEPPEETARRELAEEVGLAAARVEHLARIHNSPGFTDEEGTVFLATGLTDVGRSAQGHEEQHMTVRRVPVAEGLAMIDRGEITDVKTIVGFLQVARRHGARDEGR